MLARAILLFIFVSGVNLKDLEQLRDSRVFSIFSIVQFKNSGCISTMTLSSGQGAQYRNGTCLTSAECTEKSGASSGTCAGGFGVCCVFMTSSCGSSVSQNCTYIKNPGFPSAYTATSGCSFVIQKCDSSVCDIRLDFEQFATNAPSTTNEDDAPTGHACQDILTVTTQTGQAVPEICGSNAGQHIYLDMGRTATDSVNLAFTFSGTFNRMWDIKVTQIPCDVNYDPPSGCLQYHTGLDGRFETFNFDGTDSQFQHLRNQDYRVCVRQEEGYCCIVWRQCASDSFRLNNGGVADWSMAKVGTNCPEDYIGIESSSFTGSGGVMQKYCGGFLSATDTAIAGTGIRDCTPPFEVQVYTDATQDPAASGIANGNKGVCLMYNQEPCAAGNIAP